VITGDTIFLHPHAVNWLQPTSTVIVLLKIVLVTAYEAVSFIIHLRS